MKLITSFLFRYGLQIMLLALFIFIFGVIYFFTSGICSLEIPDFLYREVINGSGDFVRIKDMSAAFLSNDGQIDYCEYSELTTIYNELTSSKFELMESL
ncbi:hypothetical protein [Vibrio kanaloae]|uniref:hypothetical protein n=1 Tax=Vibrio kanaloae TaxID=170673 RepID=UPI0011B394B4|nr:hypothetical protein [Vibrio kanaloae]